MTALNEAPVIVRTRALSVGHRGRALLGPIDVEIRAGELWAIVGRNGSGKSTWLRTLLGLLPPVSGSVEWLVSRPQPVYVAQDSKFDAVHPISVGDVVALGGMRGVTLARHPVDVTYALDQVGLTDQQHRLYRELSAGQRQRVQFARAWASARDLVVLDEPTSAMDEEAEDRAFELLAELARERATAVVVVGHDHALLGRFADRVLLFDRSRGQVVVGSTTELLRSERSRATS